MLNEPDADMIPYMFSTASVRSVGDTYNWLLAQYGTIHFFWYGFIEIYLQPCGRTTMLPIHTAREGLLGKGVCDACPKRVCKRVCYRRLILSSFTKLMFKMQDVQLSSNVPQSQTVNSRASLRLESRGCHAGKHVCLNSPQLPQIYTLTFERRSKRCAKNITPLC